MYQIPKSVIVNTGDQEQVSQTIDGFFKNTSDLIGVIYEINEKYFEIKSGEISYRSGARSEDISSRSRVVSDDRITHLSYRDRIIAGVLETRTENNRVLYSFFRCIESLHNLNLKRKQ